MPAKKKSFPSRENFVPSVVTKPAGTASAGELAKAAAMIEENFMVRVEIEILPIVAR